MQLLSCLWLLLATSSLVAGRGGATKGLLPEIEDVQGQEHLLFMTEEDRIDGKQFEDGIHFELVQLEAAFWMEDDDESRKKGKKESNRQRRLKTKKVSDLEKKDMAQCSRR